MVELLWLLYQSRLNTTGSAGNVQKHAQWEAELERELDRQRREQRRASPPVAHHMEYTHRY